jgi:hypothetical protein
MPLHKAIKEQGIKHFKFEDLDIELEGPCSVSLGGDAAKRIHTSSL